MKQRITQEQMDELTDAEKLKLADWADPIDDLDWPWSSGGVIRKGKLPLLTIGQMIWFLDDHHATTNEWYHGGFLCKRDVVPDHFEWHVYRQDDWHGSPEIVDVLWMAVKAVLKERVNNATNEA